jgi:hypothetical protein
MKSEIISNMISLHALLSVLMFTNTFVFAQEDNPNFDRVPIEWLLNINYSDSDEDVVTDIDGYDNFNLGVDFAEPHLSQNPNNPLQYFGAYNINNAWRTTDGHNWTGSTPSFGVSVNGDPCTAYDGVGNLYYESMYGGVTGCKVMRSTNNGATWSSAVTAISGNDKNWLAADQTTGPYANYIYTTMTPGNFARSTNFGATWTTTATFSTQTLPGMMVCVGPNGTTDGGAVYVVTNSGNTFASTYTFYVSTNGGLNFTQKSAQNFANYVGTDVNGRNSVQNMRTRPYPFIAADQSNGTYRGRLYCIYASNTPAGNGNKPDIFCRYSTNQGSTWSSAIRINDDLNTTNHNQWHPSIWCDKSSGRLFVKWMDTRDTPTSDSAYIYASYSDNGGITWASNQRISNQKMKIDCSTCGGGGTPRYQGDYDAIVSTNNQAIMMWTDFRDGTFGSYVGYFPDFAMKVSPLTSIIDYNNDSTFIVINVPEVKLYNSTAIFSANITPTPINGSFIIDFPQGNTLNSFPGSVNLRIRTSGNVTLGNYTINIKGEGLNGTPVHYRNASLQVVVPALDFGVDMLAYDNCLNQVTMKFGTAAGATDCYDPGLDMSAPPPPPGGAFDGRFVSCNEGFFTDIKATNLTEERIWNLQYQAAEGCSPVTISWNPAQLPANGYFHLVDAVLGTLVNVNMRMTNSYTDVVGIGQLQIKYNYEFCTNYSINANWNMISLPLGVSNSNYLTLFPNAVMGSLYGYSGGYYSTQNIANCTGYWIKFPSSQLVAVCGTDITECVLNLSSGWNMIGGPNCNVPLSSVIDPGGIIIPGTLYRYSGTYSTANTIDATKAYWLKTSGSGTITVSCGNLLSNKESQLVISEDAVSGFGKIEVKDALENSQTLYFNGKLSDEVSIESYSLPPLPPAGGFDARIAGDYRLSEREEVEINLQAGEYPVKVRIENIDFSEDYKVIEISNGSEVGSHRINSGEEIVITNKEVKTLKITKQEMLPSTYNLEQNYPNPFNPGTTIKFSLPEASKVTLNIYNTLGEKIAELVNTNLEAGKYSYQWDAGETASGIYIYELRTDKFNSMKKMILLK